MTDSLAHSKWVCKIDHIVFTPKYRRKIDYWGMREDIRDIIRDLCKWKGVAILEGKVMPDHIHLMLSIPPKYSVSGFMGYLKGKSAMMLFERHANLKYKYGTPPLLGHRALCQHSRLTGEGSEEVYPRAGETGSD